MCHILDLESNSKTNYYGTVVAKESVVVLTTKQLVEKMNQLGLNSSISYVYENYLRTLDKQGIVDYCKSVINDKEDLYYPVNSETDDDGSSSTSTALPLTEDCRLINIKSFDEKKVLEYC